MARAPRGSGNGSEELHRLVLSSISDAVFITSEDGVFTYICPNVHTIFGYSREEVAGLGTIQRLLGAIRFERSALDARRELENIDHVVRDKAGQEHALLVNVKRVDIDGGTVLYTCRDVTERRKIEQALVRSEGRLRELGRQLVSAHEAERARVSRELHDEAGQSLTALKIHLELLQDSLGGEAARQVRDAVGIVEATMDRVRFLAADLRPPALDTLGLEGALEGCCRTFERRIRMPIRYDGGPLPELPDAARLSLYRFLQEALTNAAKHAEASEVRVEVTSGDGVVRLAVEDDGTGFDVSKLPAADDRPHIGLAGMRERLELLGGTLEIDSTPGRGTHVTAVVPVPRPRGGGMSGRRSR